VVVMFSFIGGREQGLLFRSSGGHDDLGRLSLLD
jgi:hypothetical protein